MAPVRSQNRVAEAADEIPEIPEKIRWLADYLQPSEHDRLAELLSAAASSIPEHKRELMLEEALEDAELGGRAAQDFAAALEFHRSDEPHTYTAFFDLGDEAVDILGKHVSWIDLVDELSLYPEDLPAWVTLDYRYTRPRDWLVHCTDSPREIYAEGFRRGVEDLSRIALTTHLPDVEKRFPGYNFAYEPDDFDRYAHNERWGFGCKYGRHVLLLRSAYVSAYHSGDQEPQAVFWGPSAGDVVWLDVAERGNYAVELDDGELLEATEIPDLIDLIEEHWDRVPRRRNPFVPRALLERLSAPR